MFQNQTQFRVQGVYPQSLGGLVFPRDLPRGAWKEETLSAAASITIAPYQAGSHFAIECQLRDSTAATSATLACKVNGDTTTGDYHWQDDGASNGAAAVTEATTFDIGLIPGANAVANYYSSVWFLFTEFRNSTRQKLWYVTGSVERVALDQQIYQRVGKRQTAGVGTLIDPITSIQLVGQGNLTGTVRYACILRGV